MTETRKIIITGTHLTPAIEFINQLKADQSLSWEISYIGRRYNSSNTGDTSIESKIIPNLKIKFYGILCGKFDRRWLPNTLRGIPQIYFGFKQSLILLKKIKPHLVVSFGGYVSVPVVIAAWFQKIPSLTHEQTPTLSLATKINSLFCRLVALSFPNNNTAKKYIVTGNLLRREIFNHHSNIFKKCKENLKKYPLIYFTAGNQGSHHLNIILKKILPNLSPKYIIIHQSGQKDYAIFKRLSFKFPNYIVKNYISSTDIGWVFHHCQLVISRSGANTTQEIAALKLNSILIPLPVSQQNEQFINALWLKKQLPNNTIIIKDADLTTEILTRSIEKLINTKKIISKNPNSPNLRLLKLIKRL